jgi:uncharacterized iron-regulated membrane protein
MIRTGMRKVLLTLHLYAALIAGVFIVILGVTGCIMAFEPEIDHLIHPKLSYVIPQAHTLSLAEIGDIVTKAFPRERITAYSRSNSPDISTQVFLRGSAVFINQYTGEILGMRPPGMDFLGYVHQLHLRLLIRNKADTGKTIMSWTGVVMLFLLLSGLYLWWPLKRVSIQTGGPPRRFWFDLHNATGIFSLVFLLLLTFTGLMIGFDDSVVPLFYKMTGSQPSGQPNVPAPPPDAKPISPDQAMEIAGGAIPGATPFQIYMPAPKAAYQIRSRFPEDLTPGGRSRVIVDQYTGTVLFAESSRTAPAGTRIVIQNRAIHTGDIFGNPGKAIASIASLMAAVQLVSGFAMWLRREKKKRPTPDAYETVAR